VNARTALPVALALGLLCGAGRVRASGLNLSPVQVWLSQDTSKSLLTLRNEGPDAAVILISDGNTGQPVIPPWPNPPLVASAPTLRFLAELLVLNGTNSTAKITLLDDPGAFSDSLIVQLVPRIPTTFKVADVPINGQPGTVPLTEGEELAGVAIKCYIRNAQWLQEVDWALLETNNSRTAISDLLLLRNDDLWRAPRSVRGRRHAHHQYQQ